MATPYIKHDGVNYKIQAGLPSAGVNTLQFTDSTSSFTQTVPAATGTLALTTIATGTNALVTTDMAAGFRALDGLVMPNVLGYLTNTPPVSPANGDCYIVGAAPTGAWAGQGGKVTRYSTVAAAWEFFTPKNGWTLEANSARESYRYTGSAWEIFYQEGTWTPTLAGATTAGSHTYSARFGRFTKIGRIIQVRMQITLTSFDASASGPMQVVGLPFTTDGTGYAATTIGSWGGISLSAGNTQISLQCVPSDTKINFTQSGSGLAASYITNTQFSSSADFNLCGTYNI